MDDYFSAKTGKKKKRFMIISLLHIEAVHLVNIFILV